jgi:alanine-glyoxylate transaminase/serine-glyoxylate transaminase/serine-pyruvate transaminase
MSVSAGREFLSIPGPTVIPDAVLAAMQKPAVDIYAGPLVALTDGLLADMSRIFNTGGRCYIYAANGHGAWEAALTNVLSRGDKCSSWKADASRSPGAKPRRCWARRSKCSRPT